MTMIVREPLNRQRVLEAAVRLVDRDGLSALSMRRLGAELGVEAMSLYNHVPNKAALLDGIVELMLREVRRQPSDGGADWAERLRAAARSYYRLAHAHPHIFPLVAMRPLNTIDAWRLVEGGVALGRAAGFDAEEALYAVRTCASYAAGYALNQIARDTQYTADQPADSRLDITKLPPDAFPNLASVAPYYAPAYRDIEFEFGLDAILTGLRAKLAARS